MHARCPRRGRDQGRVCTAVFSSLLAATLSFFARCGTRRDKARTEGYLSAKKSLRPFIMLEARETRIALRKMLPPLSRFWIRRCESVKYRPAKRRAARSRISISNSRRARARSHEMFRAERIRYSARRCVPSGCLNCAGKASTLRPQGGADIFIGDDASGVSLDLSNKNRDPVRRSGGREDAALSLSLSLSLSPRCENYTKQLIIRRS